MTHAQTQAESRFDRGQRALSRIDGRAGEKVVASLADIAPDFARYVIEFPFGDIYSRPDLGLRDREIATIAALTALGNAAPQLKAPRVTSNSSGCGQSNSSTREAGQGTVSLSLFPGQELQRLL
ncbi:hypothetical protein ABIF66_008721 [Bradyrhizobium japonicum]